MLGSVDSPPKRAADATPAPRPIPLTEAIAEEVLGEGVGAGLGLGLGLGEGAGLGEGEGLTACGGEREGGAGSVGREHSDRRP